MENAGNSCYIGSVLFALWHRGMHGYDALLAQSLSVSNNQKPGSGEASPYTVARLNEDAENLREMQHHLREAIIKPLRHGHVVPAHNMEILRAMAYRCGWEPDDGQGVADPAKIRVLVKDMGFDLRDAKQALRQAGGSVSAAIEVLSRPRVARPPRHHHQCDAAEFLLFLLDKLQAPRIPLVESIFHGANQDMADDFKVVTGRALIVSLGDGQSASPVRPMSANAMKRWFSPEGSKGSPLKLEKLLWMHFFDSQVSGIERKVNTGRDRDTMNEKVTGLRVLKLSPFYTFQSEDGCQTSSQSSHFQTVIIPIVLERYKFAGLTKKDSRSVEIPELLDFSPYVDLESPGDEYKLFLKSIVLHLGSEPSQGHYVAISRDEGIFGGDGGWMVHDDMKHPMSPLRNFRTLAELEQSGIPLLTSSYILIYELRNVTGFLTDEELADRVRTNDLRAYHDYQVMMRNKNSAECTIS